MDDLLEADLWPADFAGAQFRIARDSSGTKSFFQITEQVKDRERRLFVRCCKL
jgi:hypothetical protein